jgi:hypothetical protein
MDAGTDVQLYRIRTLVSYHHRRLGRPEADVNYDYWSASRGEFRPEIDKMLTILSAVTITSCQCWQKARKGSASVFSECL